MRNNLILVFCFIVSVSFGQTDSAPGFKCLTAEQNLEWLTHLKKSDKSTQLKKILDRFSDQHIQYLKPDNTPIVILDGIPISFPEIKKSNKDFLFSHLTTDHIEDLVILDEEPEELYIDKKFTGIILLTFKDKRSRKKWKKLN